ncbi:MAG TPA: type II secretion system F family protein [Thiobacillaceae bacterium]|nr:type II secretion system F family protein [Thiobacillaceae bacterium]HNA82126.1 type II secretion system F family protein [Thiobacillaceae bacterium]HNF88346.1 type II secretion system F family protein [Thiobacillaceae bacterium]HNH88534.1 type II secretion system F family protein [Thiobacillaceae bacterium]HNI06786.1 type II secretion system F family protein [Thiobacillaceae bacterium]
MLFEIRALGPQGRKTLTVEAAGAGEAAEQARGQGYQVLTVAPRVGVAARWKARRGRFPLVLFSRELMALLASGLPLTEALQTLVEKETRAETRQVLEKVVKHLFEGERFSAAIAHFPEAFPALYVSVVRASEKTSGLGEALSRYVAYQEQVEGVRKKAVAAAVYPLLLLVAGGLVALFLLGYVTPRFAGIYEGNMERLPFASRLLMQAGGFIEAHAATALAILAGFLALLYWAATRPATRAWISRSLWRMPGLGENLRVFHLTRFYRTVGMLLQGGIPVVQSLGMAEGLLHPELRLRLDTATRMIREGQSLSRAMESSGLSTPVAARLLKVGEKSGRMGDMMEAVARFHDEELARFVEWFTRLVEPLLMAIIGLVIGVIVVLLYLPIFELAGSLE